MPMAKQNSHHDHRRFVIVGGGPAALACVENLRMGGFEGEILMITEEASVPYDRTMLSKWITGNDVSKI